jgi:pimeloyl-ACP methyl ester carboxylesterase
VIAPVERFVEVNTQTAGGRSIRLHCLIWRDASGGGDASMPPLLLLHATGFLARLWQPVAEALVNRGFDVYAYDMRGHGDSDKPPPIDDAYHWRNLVSDLRSFCDALGFRDVPMIGHSSGGAAAAYLAATQPDYVSRLVLFEPIIFPTGYAPAGEGRNELVEGARKRRMVWRDADEVFETYRTRPAFARWREDVLRLYAEDGTFQREDGQIELKCPGGIEASLFDHSHSLDTWDRLAEIACPALVMHGELTGEPFPTLMSQIAQRISNGRSATIRDAGHLAPMERPGAVAQVVLDFLGGVP